jgi:hypothetical protein
MSKINIEFDTKTKTLSVKLNGVEVTDVQSVNFYTRSYRYDEKEEGYSFHLTRGTQDKDDGMSKQESLFASTASKEAEEKTKGATQHPTHNDFLLLKDSSLANSLGSYLSKYRGKV